MTPSAPPPIASGRTSPARTSLRLGIPASICCRGTYCYGWKLSPDFDFIFPTTTTVYLDDEVANWEIAGSRVSVDGAGIFLSLDKDIGVIPHCTPFLAKLRSLPIGPGTKNHYRKKHGRQPDGRALYLGWERYSSSAQQRPADPVRYILGNFQPGGGPSTATTPRLTAVDASTTYMCKILRIHRLLSLDRLPRYPGRLQARWRGSPAMPDSRSDDR
jgi:hypothetical protein